MFLQYGWKSGVCLLLLTIQTSSLILLMRHTLRHQQGTPYISESVVVSVELMKLIVSWLAEMITSTAGNRSPLSVWRRLQYDCYHNSGMVFRLAVPAALYAIQNNLYYFALRRLTAISFQVAQQLKILTTAVFAVLMLKRKLGLRQWLALTVLMLGVVVVQVATAPPTARARSNTENQRSLIDAWFGFASMLIVSLSSGFAGIYFERLIKQPTNGKSSSIPSVESPSKLRRTTSIMAMTIKNAPVRSLWIQSIELGLFGLAFSILILYTSPLAWSQVQSRGFFDGYTHTSTWIIILMQATGGMLVALVIRYADSILKAFSASASIVLSALLSWTFWGRTEVTGTSTNDALGWLGPNMMIIFGTMMVTSSLYIYASPPKSPSSPPPSLSSSSLLERKATKDL